MVFSITLGNCCAYDGQLATNIHACRFGNERSFSRDLFMSFILDALKKSENARQRQIGPAMAELPRRRRQSERPPWLWPVVALLVVNIGVLALVLLRKQGTAMQTPL